MSTTHFNPDTLWSTCHIKSVRKRFCCRKSKQPQLTLWETGPLGLRVAQLRTLLHAKQPHTHPNTHRCTQDLVADNSHPVIFDCGPLMLDQRHLTQSSEGLGPPGVPLPPQRDCQRVTSALQNKHRNLSV